MQYNLERHFDFEQSQLYAFIFKRIIAEIREERK
jgi:hypothetical protein